MVAQWHCRHCGGSPNPFNPEDEEQDGYDQANGQLLA